MNVEGRGRARKRRDAERGDVLREEREASVEKRQNEEKGGAPKMSQKPQETSAWRRGRGPVEGRGYAREPTTTAHTRRRRREAQNDDDHDDDDDDDDGGGGDEMFLDSKMAIFDETQLFF